MNTVLCLWIILSFLCQFSHGFQSISRDVATRHTSKLNYSINISGWFSRSSGEKKKRPDESGNLEGIPQIMDSMDDFKQVQRMGKITSGLVQELSSSTVEGVGADGKVKVTLNLQQKPMGLSIDEEYFKSSDVLEVTNALTTAMKEAHSKSTERMDERMKSFYSDLGLS